jgi:Vacuolar protein sorting-associated protein 26
LAVLLDQPQKQVEGTSTLSLREDNASIDVDFKRYSYHMKDIIEGTVKLLKSRCDLKSIDIKIVREECIPPSNLIENN